MNEYWYGTGAGTGAGADSTVEQITLILVVLYSNMMLIVVLIQQ